MKLKYYYSVSIILLYIFNVGCNNEKTSLNKNVNPCKLTTSKDKYFDFTYEYDGDNLVKIVDVTGNYFEFIYEDSKLVTFNDVKSSFTRIGKIRYSEENPTLIEGISFTLDGNNFGFWKFSYNTSQKLEVIKSYDGRQELDQTFTLEWDGDNLRSFESVSSFATIKRTFTGYDNDFSPYANTLIYLTNPGDAAMYSLNNPVTGSELFLGETNPMEFEYEKENGTILKTILSVDGEEYIDNYTYECK